MGFTFLICWIAPGGTTATVAFTWLCARVRRMRAMTFMNPPATSLPAPKSARMLLKKLAGVSRGTSRCQFMRRACHCSAADVPTIMIERNCEMNTRFWMCRMRSAMSRCPISVSRYRTVRRVEMPNVCTIARRYWTDVVRREERARSGMTDGSALP